MLFDLRPHPANPAPQGLRLTAEIIRSQSVLRIAYRLEGSVAQIRWPDPALPVRADDLWKTTCCEAFIQAEAPAYVELNAAPTGAWAAYAFAKERDENRTPASLAVAVTSRRSAGALHLEAAITGSALSWAGPWRAGLTAVLEDTAGGLSYWALNHPKDKPDFHDPRGFAALISAPNVPGDTP